MTKFLLKKEGRQYLCFKYVLLSAFFFLCNQFVYSQNKISGTVTNENAETLIGVNIFIKSTTTGTISDIDGTYSLEVNEGDVLVFSYTGYQSKEITVGNATVVDVVLVSGALLEEIVVVGYGSLDQKEATGAVASVKVENLPSAAILSVDNMLQGQVAGLNLNLQSAQPGGRLDIVLRGAVSPNGSNSPLFVVDGVPLLNNSSGEPGIINGDIGFGGGVDRSPLSTINPADIESVDVLKDASATAIYGSAAANGVILITTKKGKSGQFSVDYKGAFSIQSPKDYIEYLDAKEFRSQLNRMSYERYLFDNRIAPYGNNSNPGTFIPRFTDEEVASVGEGTDWVGDLIKTGTIQEHNVAISSGSENTRIYSSFNYLDNEPILVGSDYKRYTARLNFDQNIGDRFLFSSKINYSQVNSNNASTGSNSGGNEKFNMLQAAFAYAPDIPVYEEDGTFSRSYSPLITNPQAFLEIDDELKTTRFSITPQLDVDILEDLQLTVLGGLDRTTSTRRFFMPTIVENAQLPNGMGQLRTNNIDNLTGEAYFTYKKNIGNNFLTLVGGVGYYKTVSDGFSMQGVGFFTNAFGFNNIGISSDIERNQQSSFRSEATKLSQFFRANFSMGGKYIFSVVGRRDGASNFAANKKWGFFPGVSAAWRLSEEPFLANAKNIDDLKIRVGYGQVGSDGFLLRNNVNSLPLFEARGTYIIGDNIQQGVILSQAANDELSWETNVNVNLGVDFGFFRNRVRGSLDLFRRTAKNLLDFAALPSNSPIGRVATNIGSTRSQGVELALNTINITSGDFEWSSNLTLSSFKVTWIERNPELELSPWQSETDGLRDVFGFETDGLVTSLENLPAHMPDAFPGNVIYVDQNGDGVLDENDVVKIGNWDPKISYGLGNTFRYKSLALSIYAYGNAGALKGYGLWPSAGSLTGTAPENTRTTLANVWTSNTPNGFLPGIAANLYNGANPAPRGRTDYLMKDTYFIRLKSINLSYGLPLSGKNLPFKSVNFFVDLQNLFLITNFEGFDPELNNTNPYPQAVTTTFGVDVKF